MQSLLIVLNILYKSVVEIYVERDTDSVSFSDRISGPVLEIVNQTRPKTFCRTKELAPGGPKSLAA